MNRELRFVEKILIQRIFFVETHCSASLQSGLFPSQSLSNLMKTFVIRTMAWVTSA